MSTRASLRHANSALAIALLASSCATSSIGPKQYEKHGDEIRAESKPVPLTPYQPDNYSPRFLTLPVHFNGHAQTCILDTGAATSIIEKSEFSSELPHAGRAWTIGYSGEAVATFIVKVSLIDIGGVIVPDAKFVLSEATFPQQYNCVLGIDILSRLSAFSIDTQKLKFQVVKDLPKAVTTSPLSVWPQGHFGIPVHVGTQSIDAFFDTGCTFSGYTREIIEANRQIFTTYGSPVNGTDIHGKPISMQPYLLSQVEIGAQPIRDTITTEIGTEFPAEIRAQGITGLNDILRANWFFDLRRGRWAVESTGDEWSSKLKNFKSQSSLLSPDLSPQLNPKTRTKRPRLQAN